MVMIVANDDSIETLLKASKASSAVLEKLLELHKVEDLIRNTGCEGTEAEVKEALDAVDAKVAEIQKLDNKPPKYTHGKFNSKKY